MRRARCENQAKDESEGAVAAMEGAVEAVLYDRGADLIAQIFLEERKVVQLLHIRPWQVCRAGRVASRESPLRLASSCSL